jgi:SNF2 family DNA or RNA helicase
VLIGSIETIGESLNLQYCSRAVRVDRHWNPGKNSQTKDRLIRDGQTESVVFYDLIARDTVDELRVQPALTSKESLRKAVFGS